jgi:hypothetical protein
MATPAENEKRLDAAQKFLKMAVDDVNKNPTKYNERDRRELFNAWVALDRVTLRPDSDFNQ